MSSASEELNQYWPAFRQSKRYAPLLGIGDAEIKHILTGIVELVMAQNQHHIKAWQINESGVQTFWGACFVHRFWFCDSCGCHRRLAHGDVLL